MKQALAKLAAYFLLMLVVGQRLIPFILHYVMHTGSRELFRLAVLVLALSVAFGSAQLFGVSFALGAFFAGMVLAESTLSQQAAHSTQHHHARAGSRPRNLPDHRRRQCICSVPSRPRAAPLALHRPDKRRVLSQIGEFSVILAGLGVGLQLLPENGRDLILAGAILSILANPLLFFALDKARPGLSERGRRMQPTAVAETEPDELGSVGFEGRKPGRRPLVHQCNPEPVRKRQSYRAGTRSKSGSRNHTVSGNRRTQ